MIHEERPWYSLLEGDGPHPPYDTWVETKGGYGPDEIVKDYFSKSIGGWINQPGDPSHWRPMPVQPNAGNCTKPKIKL